MYPTLFDENKLLLIDRFKPAYFPATYIPQEYLQLIIPYAGLYYEQDDDYNMLSQHIQLGPFSLWMHDVFARKDIVLCPYSPFHLWALHFMYEASLRAEIFKTDPFSLVEKECNLFNLYADLHRAPMPAGTKMLSFHINILPSALLQLAQIHPSLNYLTSKRLEGISGIINAQPYRINAVCNMLIKSILSCRYIEAQAHHFLYRCCLDLFLNFAHQDATADEHIISSDVHTALFNQIFSYVQDHPDMPDCLEKLSNRIDMTGAKLAQGFRQHFSIGLKPFLHMVRMMLAYNHLMTASSSLAIVAAATGYRHPDQMIRDLEHYYDCNILALRKSM